MNTLDNVVHLFTMMLVKVYGRWNGIYPTTGCIEIEQVDVDCFMVV